MNPVMIDHATRNLVKPKDWDDEKHGRCGSLPIRDEEHKWGNTMVSHWKPTVEELALLNAGHVVRLAVVGEVHPPVALEVE